MNKSSKDKQQAHCHPDVNSFHIGYLYICTHSLVNANTYVKGTFLIEHTLRICQMRLIERKKNCFNKGCTDRIFWEGG